MKAITLWQPWASLIALPEGVGKRIETRSWPTTYRGPLAIHAAMQGGADAADAERDATANNEHIRAALAPTIEAAKRTGTPFPPRGSVVAVADLFDCCEVRGFCAPTDDEVKQFGGGYHLSLRNTDGRHRKLYLRTAEAAFGDFAIGRWLWLLGSVVTLPTPVPCRGAQRIWDVPDDVVAKIDAQILEAHDGAK